MGTPTTRLNERPSLHCPLSSPAPQLSSRSSSCHQLLTTSMATGAPNLILYMESSSTPAAINHRLSCSGRIADLHTSSPDTPAEPRSSTHMRSSCALTPTSFTHAHTPIYANSISEGDMMARARTRFSSMSGASNHRGVRTSSSGSAQSQELAVGQGHAPPHLTQRASSFTATTQSEPNSADSSSTRGRACALPLRRAPPLPQSEPTVKHHLGFVSERGQCAGTQVH